MNVHPVWCGARGSPCLPAPPFLDEATGVLAVVPVGGGQYARPDQGIGELCQVCLDLGRMLADAEREAGEGWKVERGTRP